MTISAAPKLVCFDGQIATLTKARKVHWCKKCNEMIAPAEHYYCVVIAGGGLCSLKFPQRVHIGCLRIPE